MPPPLKERLVLTSQPPRRPLRPLTRQLGKGPATALLALRPQERRTLRRPPTPPPPRLGRVSIWRPPTGSLSKSRGRPHQGHPRRGRPSMEKFSPPPG